LEQKNKLIYQSKKPKNLPKIKANFLSLSWPQSTFDGNKKVQKHLNKNPLIE
jgi:hypothetical protein